MRTWSNLLSSILPAFLAALVAALSAGLAPATAHEIRPAIADLRISGERVEIEIRLSLETLLAGIDASAVADTNDSPNAARYDALRALEPAALHAAFETGWPGIAGGIRLRAGETPLTPEPAGLEIPPPGDLTLPRDSLLRLQARLPDDGTPVVFGWDAAYGPLVVRQILASGDGYSGYLTGGDMSEPMPRERPARQPWARVFADYVKIGFEHIVPKGLDHILFVLGLFFFSLKLRPLLFQVTAFTAAHTATLALAALGIVQIPPAVVEPLIAASIVYVAVENILLGEMRPWRPVVVFGFGLLHGLGFAAVLGEIGLDPARFATGLIGFNIGVELGQLGVIGAAWALLGYPFGRKPWYRRAIARPASLAIALVGAFWFVERVFL